MRKPAERSIMTFRGLDYEVDLRACRLAFVRGQVDRGYTSMASLAADVGVSRSTVSRFFSGRKLSLAVTLAILARLGVTFDDVVTLVGGGNGYVDGPVA